MTQRERHTLDQGTPLDTTGAPQTGRSAPRSSHGAAQPALGDVSLWSEWYHRASPAQQNEMLSRASQQGILYAHQLAAPTHSTAPRRTALAALLNGHIQEMEPLHPPPLEYHDRQLDRTQRDAVDRALATPDLCLIQGFPGTGKSRIIAEIILQAAQRGERVLFLAPTAAALDRVLERLGSHPTVCPIRCLAPDEVPETLPACIVRLTMAGRLRSYQELTLPAARAARDAARQAYEVRLRERSLWTRLVEAAERQEQLAARLRMLTEHRAGLGAEGGCTDELAAPFRAQWDACAGARMENLDRLESQLAGLRAELDTIAGKQGHLENEWERIRPLAEARQHRRFWTATWWRARMQTGLAEQERDLEMRRAELHAARQRLEQDITARLAEYAAIEDHYAVECRRLKDAEIARRQAELDAEIAAVSREQDTLREQWRTTCQAFALGAAPTEMSRQATLAACATWEQQRQRDEQQAESAEQWLQATETGLRTAPERLAGCANVVAATTTTLPRDAHFGEHNGTPILFDVLILDETHQVTESEFATAARRARRWVLVGEPQTDAEHPSSAPRKAARAAVPQPGFFQRLWQNLHAEPHRLPFVWMQREDRLVCRLRSIPADHEKWIESEPIVDRPEIELRIVAAPRQTPQVAEVVFPAGIGIAEAKQFIFHELDELAVSTRARALGWSETDAGVVLEFVGPAVESDAAIAALEDGVCERVVCARPTDGIILWHTSHLQFARVAGWTLERAEQWVAEHLGLRSTGRTVLLTVPHRLDPPLAHFLSDLLFAGACEPLVAMFDSAGSQAPVEFVAVPPLASLENRHRPDTAPHCNGGESSHASGERGQAALSVRAPRLRSVKGGAGLEMDLADNRPLEHLPADLRALLPRQGVVNYLEARAVVKRLETLVDDVAFQAACERWQQRLVWSCEPGCGCPRPEHGPAIAVMALYSAQVELLRHLIRQTPALTKNEGVIEVGLPSAFHQRECLLACVSLTRSHTHRAVSYGDHPHVLTQALTRAASGLILFGDPGTLARRSQWHGPLDHLDETAAQGEGRIVSRLVHYLQGHGRHPASFHIQEGSGV
ncbi:MAG TPA: AAA domain-containing protein [Gemmataceae bacterium]|nr:AAA domain-containing protein [Gemmataceae bacterium]